MAATRAIYRTFTVRILIAALVGAAGVLAVTICVDPFAFFGSPRINGVNALKIETGNDRLVKAAALRRHAYTGVILGTSQAQFGIDPQHASLREWASDFYNSGLVGATPYQLRRYLMSANSRQQLEAAVLVVDALMFSEHEGAAAEEGDFGFDERRLPIDARGAAQPFASFVDFAAVAFTLDALRKSLSTVRHQEAFMEWITPLGMRARANLQQGAWGGAGPRGSFEESEKTYFEWFLGYTLTPVPGRLPKLAEADAILRYCRDNNIRLSILFAPTHARYYQLLAAMDLTEEVEQLKRDLAARVFSEDAPDAKQAQVELWDFSAANELTSEAVPEDRVPNLTMDWYYDTAHFRPALGGVMLDRVILRDERYPDFGRPMTPDNLDAVLRHVRDSHLQYAASHPKDVREVREAVRRLRLDAEHNPPVHATRGAGL